MARLVSLICILSLCVSAAFAAPGGVARPGTAVQHLAMNHPADPGTHPAHDAGGIVCEMCVLHCIASDFAAIPKAARAIGYHVNAYPLTTQRIPASVDNDAPERPPKSDLV